MLVIEPKSFFICPHLGRVMLTATLTTITRTFQQIAIGLEAITAEDPVDARGRPFRCAQRLPVYTVRAPSFIQSAHVETLGSGEQQRFALSPIPMQTCGARGQSA